MYFKKIPINKQRVDLALGSLLKNLIYYYIVYKIETHYH